jgi:hypothetical protein
LKIFAKGILQLQQVHQHLAVLAEIRHIAGAVEGAG